MLLGDAKRNAMAGSVTFLLEPLPSLAALERLWRSFDRTGSHSFFVSWTWIGTLLRIANRQPYLLRAVRGSDVAGLGLLTLGKGTLWGFLPAETAWLNATGSSLLDSVMIEHNGFAVPTQDCDQALLTSLVDWFASGGLAANELTLPGVSCGRGEMENSSLYQIEKRSTGYRTPLRGLGDDGIASLLSRNARQQLRRSVRDYQGSISLTRAHDVETALEYFTQMKDLHVRSWTRRGRGHAFHRPHFETFHRALISNGVEDNSVDLLRIAAGDNVLGYLYNFRRNGIVSSYQSGFADGTPGLRPGYVCHATAIAHYAKLGMRYYDFLAGTNRLKQSFGIESYELCWRSYRKRTLAFTADALLRKAGRLFSRP